MPKRWSEVVANPDFQSLDIEQRKAARDQYFNSVVAPQIPYTEWDAAKSQFMEKAAFPEESTAPSSARSFARGAGEMASDFLKGEARAVARDEQQDYNKMLDIERAMDAIDSTPSMDDESYRDIIAQSGISPTTSTTRFGVPDENRQMLDTYRAAKISGDADTAAKIRNDIKTRRQSYFANTDTEQYAVHELGAQLGEGLEESIPLSGQEDEYWYNKYFFRPAGQTAVLAPSAVLPGGAINTAIVGSSIGREGDYQQAISEGSSPEQAMQASDYGAAFGLTEALPIDRILSRSPVGGAVDSIYDIYKREGFKGALKHFGRQTAEGATEEAIQEGTQAAGTELGAQATYDPDSSFTDRETITGIAEQSGEGAGAGALLNAAAVLLPGRRRGGGDTPTSPPTAESLPGVPENTPEEAPTPPPSTAPEVPVRDTRSELDEAFNTDKEISDIMDETDFPDKLPNEEVVAEAASGAEDAEIIGYLYRDKETGKLRRPGTPLPVELGQDWQDVADDAVLPAGAQIEMDEATGQRRARMVSTDITPSKPVKAETAADISLAGSQAASSPQNNRPEPSDAQKEAGNYKKGHVNVQGLNISIETPRGGERSGKGADGKPWSVTMQNDYGYVKRSKGADGEQVDVYLGDNPQNKRVFIIDQVDADTRKFDEHKAFVGFDTEKEVLDAYEAAFDDGRAMERMGGKPVSMSMPEFKEWLKNGNGKEPVGRIEPPMFQTQSGVTEPQPQPDGKEFDALRKKISGMKRPQLERRLTSLNKKLQEGIAPTTAEMFEREAIQDILPSKPEEKEEVTGDIRDRFKITRAEIIPTEGGIVAVPIEEIQQQEKTTNEEKAAERKKVEDLHEDFAEKLLKGGKYPSIQQARKEASQSLGEPVTPNTETAKLVDEQIEVGIVKAAKQIASMSGSVKQIYDKLVDIYNRQPALAQRSSTSVELQAYSTPAPVAYVASRLAGTRMANKVLEPTAGNGMLLIESTPANVDAVELDTRRSANIQRIYPGINATTKDFLSVEPKGRIYDSVLTNPPFGKIPGGKKHAIGQADTDQIDQAIALEALGDMREDGRAVLIIGSKRGTGRFGKADDVRDKYNTANARLFFKHLYDNYNVVDHFSLSGNLYKKQGAGYPIDMIVVNGVGKSSLPLPGAKAPRLYESFEQLKEVLEDGYNERVLHSPKKQASGADDSVQPSPLQQQDQLPDDGAGANTGADIQDRRVESSADTERSTVIDRSGDTVVPSDQEGGVGLRTERTPADEGSAESGDTGRSEESRSDVTTDDNGRSARGSSDDSTESADSGQKSRLREKGKVSDSGLQISYSPRSKSKSLDTLVPVKMAESIDKSLDKIENRVGDIDQYVAAELGYSSTEELYKYFGAEQIEAVALAIDNIGKNAGFIIGDQTGVGKGRVNAAILRYARLKGKTPIFITKQPGLYGDMYRDLDAIGERNLKAFITNSDMRGSNALSVDETGDTIESLPKKQHERAMNAIIRTGKLPENYNYFFTTYSQLQTVKGQSTPRHDAILALAPNAIISMDESHEAGGTSQTGIKFKKKDSTGAEIPPHLESRAAFARHLVEQASGLMYSSATFAKNPGTMTLYAKTDLRYAVDKPEDLESTIQKGGVPYQQVLSTYLVESGQMVRREKSYDGISMQLEEMKTNAAQADDVAGALSQIFAFDVQLGKLRKQIKEDQRSKASALSRDSAIAEAGISSTSFASIMHNIVGQALVAQKVKQVAARAVELHKQGKKPVIAVSNTNESFFADYMKEESLKYGDSANKLNFNRMLERYLDRTRHYTIKDSEGNKEEGYISDNELSAAGLLDGYNELKKEISRMDFEDVPISPIDYLHAEMRKAGMKTGELTGREITIDYQKGQQFTKRAKSDAQKKRDISNFNNGKLDALILNRSGSTGYSMHSKEGFTDTKPRHMIILQAEPNIDVYMQMLGRINRTGQVNLPSYSIMISDIPVERRPAAVLMKKLGSLNANTTANKRGATTIDSVIDFMNVYGDNLVADLLVDEPELSRRLDVSPPTDASKVDGLAAQVTGRLAIMPIKEQSRVLNLIESRYKRLIDYLDSVGENTLEAKEIDFQAETISSAIIDPSTGSSPFQKAVKLEKMSVKRQGKPYTIEQVKGKINEALAGKTAKEHSEALKSQYFNDTNGEWRALEARAANTGEEKAEKRLNEAQDIRSSIIDFIDTYYVGTRVTLKSDEGNIHGIVLEITRDESRSPVALSQFNVTVAVADATRELTIPLSQLVSRKKGEQTKYTLEPSYMNEQRMEEMFALGARDVRVERYMVTGNIVRGYGKFQQGQIIFFTRKGGSVDQGILLPASFKPETAMKTIPLRVRNAKEAVEIVNEGINVVTGDGTTTVEKVSGDQYRISISRAGRKYYTSKKLRNALGGDLYSRTGEFSQMFNGGDKLKKVFDALVEEDATLMVKDSQDKVREMRGEEAISAQFKRSTPGADEGTGYVKKKKKWTDAEKKIANNIRKLAKERFGDGLRIEFSESIYDENGVEVFGLYSQTEGSNGAMEYIAYVSLSQNNANPVGTLNHEGIHYFRRSGIISEREWGVLSRMAREKWIKEYNIEENYEGASQELKEEEAVAEAFGAQAKWNRYPPTVRVLFNKIYKFLSDVKAFLNGQGFTKADQIFANISAGTFKSSIRERMSGQLSSDGKYQPNTGVAFQRGKKQAIQQQYDLDLSDRGIVETVLDANMSALDKFKTLGKEETYQASTDMARKKLQDSFIYWRRMQKKLEDQLGKEIPEAKDFYLKQELLPGRIGAEMDKLERDYKEPILKLLADYDAKHGNAVETLDKFLVAIHAKERNEQIAKVNEKMPDGGAGMKTDEAAAHIDQLKQEGKYDDLKQISDLVRKMLDESLLRRLNAGLITKEYYNQLTTMYKNYFPLRGVGEIGDMVDTGSDRARGGRGTDIRGKEFYAAHGRTTLPTDVLAYAFTSAEESIIRSEKQKPLAALYKLVKEFPSDIWQISKPKMRPVLNPDTGLITYRALPQTRNYKLDDYTVGYKLDGVQKLITIKDKRLAEPLKHMNIQHLPSFMNILVMYSKLFRASVTSWSPEFILRNLMKDTQTVFINLKEYEEKGYKGISTATLRDANKARKAMWKLLRGKEQMTTEFDKFAAEFFESGGSINYWAQTDIAGKRTKLKRDLYITRKGFIPKGIRGGRAILMLVEQANRTVENMYRLSAYANLRKMGMSKEKAGQVALNITVNFTKRGDWGSFANVLWIFFNAGVQGNIRIMQAMRRSKKVRRVVASMTAASFALAMLNSLMSPEDDDGELLYDKIPEFVKQGNIVIMDPTGQLQKIVNGIFPIGNIENVHYIKIPMAWGYNAMWYTGTAVADYMRGAKKSGDMIGDIAVSYANAFNPLGGTDYIWNILAPTFLDPFVDVSQNRNFAGYSIYPEAHPNDNSPPPPSEQYFKSVSALSKNAMKALNSWTGGDEVTPGAISISPELVDYAIGNFIGSLGIFVGNTIDTAVKGWTNDDHAIGKVPFMRAVMGAHEPWYNRSAAYERIADVKLIGGRYEDYRDRKMRKEADALYAENKAVLDAFFMNKKGNYKNAINALDANLKDIRHKISMAKTDKNLSEEARKRIVANLESKELSTVNEFNKKYLEARRLDNERDK